MPRFVQLPHPKDEHKPDADNLIGWNTKDHKRKFMQGKGGWLDGDVVKNGDIWLWGEWEPDSEVIRTFRPGGTGFPKYLWHPYLAPKADCRGYQNTDPCVFGGFFYAICRQPSEPALKGLTEGSVIVFGSRLNREWVVDTVFVVSKPYPYNIGNYKDVLKKLGNAVPDGYRQAVIEPVFANDPRAQLTLYIGATYENPVDGLYSFFPCKPQGQSFRRPFLQSAGTILSPYFNPDCFRRAKGATGEQSKQTVKALWEEVKKQILHQGLCLGIRASFPEIRQLQPGQHTRGDHDRVCGGRVLVQPTARRSC